MAGGIVFQGAETNRKSEDVTGDQRQCGQDTDLDSVDRHAGPEVLADEVHLWLVAFQSGGATAPATVYLPRSVGMAEPSARGATSSPPTRPPLPDAGHVEAERLP